MDAGRARDSLNGLALGDAFGETWFRISAGEAERRRLTRGAGDLDTTCAIAGGIVAARTGSQTRCATVGGALAK